MGDVSPIPKWIPFRIVTDHKPLEVVFKKPTYATSPGVQRIVHCMMDYDFVVEYRPGKDCIIHSLKEFRFSDWLICTT